MGSPLGPVIADIFMIELEKTLLPNLREEIKFWKRYVGDTICVVKNDKVDQIVST